MEEYIFLLKKLWANKKYRLTLTLSSFTLLLLIVLVIKTVATEEEKKVPEGALRVAMCDECYHQEIRRIKNFGTTRKRCSKCGGKLFKCLKCSECDFEFPYKDERVDPSGLTKSEIFVRMAEMRKCPKCGSTRTYFLSPTKFRKRNKKK
jgi:hypothetical protein